MQEITKYLSNDGCEFNDAAECANYEAEAEEIAKIVQRLPPSPKVTGFSNGEGYLQHDRETFLRVQADLARLVRKHFKDKYSLPHIDWTINADRPAGMTSIGRLIDDGMGKAMRHAWFRICCVDNEFREWGQPFFAINPGKGTLRPL